MASTLLYLEKDVEKVLRDYGLQRSVYNTPGLLEKEIYRLSTLNNLPFNAQVVPCQLSCSGFNHTGRGDRAKCTSDGRNAGKLEMEDNPKSPNWHQRSCEIIDETDTNNALNYSSTPQTAARPYSKPPADVDEEESRIRSRKVEEEIKSSALVAELKAMGIREGSIREALKRKYERSNCSFSDLGSFVEQLLVQVEEGDTKVPEEPISSSNQSRTIINLEEEIKCLEDSKPCKSCKTPPGVLVFIPCGQLLCSVECGKSFKNYLVGKTVITEPVRTFSS